MIRKTNSLRLLALAASIAAMPYALSAATIYVDDVAGPGTGTVGDPFSTIQLAVDYVQASGSDGDVIYINGGTYNDPTLVNAFTKNNITIQGDPADRPVLNRGIRFQNDVHSGLTIENIVFQGKYAATGADYLLQFMNNGTGRTDVTIQNCKFDGQNVGVYPTDQTQGVNLAKGKGTFTFQNNEVTRITGNVILSTANAGSISYADYTAGLLPTTCIVKGNNFHNTTGAIDTRGCNGAAATPVLSNLATNNNPTVYFIDNSYTDLVPSAAATGGAFKLFHAKAGYFYGNTVQGTGVTGNNYSEEPCVAAGNPDVVHSAGLLWLNVGKLEIAGNTFIDCLQGIGHDPNGGTRLNSGNSGTPSIMNVYNNTFAYCGLAVYFTSLTNPGYNYSTASGTACGSWVADPNWVPANFTDAPQALAFYDNNFIGNTVAIRSEAPDSADLPIDASDNYWGNGTTPDPGQIELPYETDTPVDTSNPQPDLILQDSDGDGLSDTDELVTYFTDPNDADSDDDTYSDGLEVALGSDPNNAGSVPASPPVPGADTDGDGYTDEYEIEVGTDWNNSSDKPALGDANGDGQVDNVDALITVGVVVQAAGFDVNRFNFNAMDVNKDGIINNLDAIALINFFLGNIDTLPPSP